MLCMYGMNTNVDLCVKGFLALCAIIFNATIRREKAFVWIECEVHFYGFTKQKKIVPFVSNGGEIRIQKSTRMKKCEGKQRER